MKYVTNTWTVSNKVSTIRVETQSVTKVISLSIDGGVYMSLDLAQSYDLIEALTEARQLIFPRVKD